MAKKKATAEPTSPPSKPRGRPKSATPKKPTPIVMTIRARPEWEAWIDSACEAVKRETGLAINVDRTDVIDVALGQLAEKLGLPVPPPRY